MLKITLKFTMVVFLLLLPYSANAYDVEVDGIYYNLSTDTQTAEVTNLSGTYPYIPQLTYVGDIIIPASIEVKNIQYSVVSIGNYAFSNCPQLLSITMPNSITRIGYKAFCDCSVLSSVIFSESLLSIGDFAFYDCSELKSLVIPNSVTIMGHSIFDNCTGLSSVILSNQIQKIDYHTFYNCKNLESIIIPESITNIVIGSFGECSKLTKVTFHCKEIGSNWFSGNSNIKTVVIGDEVTIINDFVFQDCNNLANVIIGKNVEMIKYGAFWGCNNIQEVYCYAEIIPILYTAVFHRTNISNAILHVPVTSIESYKTTSPWNEFGIIQPLTEEESDICQPHVNTPLDDVKNVWYTLDGKKLDRKPLKSGIYIRNQRKIVIR